MRLQNNMYYVYVLKSAKNNDVYVGFTRDLKTRFKSHNDGMVQSTQPYRPWELVYYEAYKNIHDAAKREKQLKSHAAKDDLREQLKNSLL